MNDTVRSFYLGYMMSLISETVLSQLARLGFSFVYDCPESVPNFRVIPPEGWMIQQGLSNDLLVISDEQNRPRVIFDYRIGGHVKVLNRFVIEVNHGIGYTSTVRDRVSDSALDRSGGHDSEENAEAAVVPWLDEHHPEWRDPLAYWD